MADLAERFGRDGIVFPVRVMEEAETAALAARFEVFRTDDGGRTYARFAKKPHLVLPWLDAVVRDPRIVGPVTAILGPDVLCWSSLFFAKGAGTGDYVGWHQDATYWGLSSADVVTAWVAFTPSTRESGCMRVVPGTHHRDVVPHRTSSGRGSDRGGDGANMLSRSQELAVEVDEAEAVDVVLRPGEMSVHHVRLFHGSEPNRAAHPRVGYAIRYVTAHVRQTAGGRDSAMLVAGRDHGTFDPEPSPVADFDSRAVSFHQGMLARQAEIQAAIG